MRFLIWFLLSGKRQLKNPFFVGMLFLVPLALFAFSGIEKADSGKIKIALFSEEQEMVPDIMENLRLQDGMFQFYVCDTLQDLKEDVAARKAECGYVFAADFKESMEERKFKRTIQVYSAPSTMMEKLSQEVVFASVIEVYGVDILKQYLEGSGVFPDLDMDLGWRELKERYDYQLREDITYHFQYETVSTGIITGNTARIMFPVRGMLAIYLMVIGIFSAVSVRRDEKKGLFVTLPSGSRFGCKLAVLAAPLSLAGVSALLTLMVTANFGNAGKELAVMLIYILMTVAYSYVLKLLVKDPVLLCGLIPVFILVCLIVCPVFLDITGWLPGLKPLRQCLLPYYYMAMMG